MTAWDDTEELEELKIAYEELKSENEKLRDAYDTDALTISYNLGYTCGKDIAKDEIERLRAENEKLRAALKPFAGFYLNSSLCTDEAVICEAEEDGNPNLIHGDLRKAYEAWRESE